MSQNHSKIAEVNRRRERAALDHAISCLPALLREIARRTNRDGRL